jgi:hypothetical protein
VDDLQLYYNLRVKLGSPDPNEVPDRELATHMGFGARQLAAKLRYVVRREQFSLTADVTEYPLPEDVLQVISVDWNSRNLDPTSLYKLDRQSGTWRHQSSANPREYFVFGRVLTLVPAPSSSAITTASVMHVQYIGAPDERRSGALALSDVDQDYLILESAISYLMANRNDANERRLADYKEERIELRRDARKRHQNALREYRRNYAPEVTRYGGSR